MDAIKNITGGIDKVLKPVAAVASPVSSIMGLIRNLQGGGAQDALVKRMQGYQGQMQNLANNPAALAARIRSLQQPLSTGLTEDVMNQVQAQLSERGLATSPNIATAVTSEALAPYELQQQQTATQALMQLLGMPIEAGYSTPAFQPTDLTSFWKKYLPQDPASATNPSPGSNPGSTGMPIDPGLINNDIAGNNLPQVPPDLLWATIGQAAQGGQ